MSIVHSYAVGNGDMFSIRHGNDNFTIIDCQINDNNKHWIFNDLAAQWNGKTMWRFISTHPDQDHLTGLTLLDQAKPITNFYCVKNQVAKTPITKDFRKYCALRDSDKAFYLYTRCGRAWLNQATRERDSSGLFVKWPNVNNLDYKAALLEANGGGSPNNISIILTYEIYQGPKFIWMGDMETDFMEKIEDVVEWPSADVLFAPHHGRSSGRVPANILRKLSPQVIIIGEAPSPFLNYYAGYNTITQNRAGSVAFDYEGNTLDIYVTSNNYRAPFLNKYFLRTRYPNYLGSLVV